MIVMEQRTTESKAIARARVHDDVDPPVFCGDRDHVQASLIAGVVIRLRVRCRRCLGDLRAA